MKKINYLKGDATEPKVQGNKILCHVCNDIGGWGKGFVLALTKKWDLPEKEYRTWMKSETPGKLGEVQFVEVAEDLKVANIIGQRGIKKINGIPPVRYDAIEAALAKVADHAKELKASIHMPRIGCGLAGGNWENIEVIIERQLISQEIDVYVYDFEAS